MLFSINLLFNCCACWFWGVKKKAGLRVCSLLGIHFIVLVNHIWFNVYLWSSKSRVSLHERFAVLLLQLCAETSDLIDTDAEKALATFPGKRSSIGI